MTYIVKEGKELKIITVRADQEDFFQADYAGRILASGNNTMEALMKQELKQENMHGHCRIALQG
jgi:hypothetical protein